MLLISFLRPNWIYRRFIVTYFINRWFSKVMVFIISTYSIRCICKKANDLLIFYYYYHPPPQEDDSSSSYFVVEKPLATITTTFILLVLTSSWMVVLSSSYIVGINGSNRKVNEWPVLNYYQDLEVGSFKNYLKVFLYLWNWNCCTLLLSTNAVLIDF